MALAARIRVGVAVAFMVKKPSKKPCVIRYDEVGDYTSAEEKRHWLTQIPLSQRKMEKIEPSKRGNWINQVENEWDDLLPIADKQTKAAKGSGQERAIFRSYTLGVVTARDEWVISPNSQDLEVKVQSMLDAYRGSLKQEVSPWEEEEDDTGVKWTRSLKRRWLAKESNVDDGNYATTQYRPYVRREMYFSRIWNEMIYQTERFFGKGQSTPYISFTQGGRLTFDAYASDTLPNYAIYSLDAAQTLPRYRYTSSGERTDNITDWALRKFQAEYGKSVRKGDIFHYCYAVLHDPVYRQTYAINLKREFPRIPFYPDFKQWVAWGEKLMELHINYEDVEPWPLERVDSPNKRAEGSEPKAMLRSDHHNGNIRLDADTQLTGVPEEAWSYKIGNRTAIDWVLELHKEKKPRDPTIREYFNTYRFADYKKKVIDLLGRVTRVSVETVEITNAMKDLNRDGWDATGER